LNRWKGKLIGFLLGLLTRRPQFVILGLILGHLFDIGLFDSRPATPAQPPASTPSIEDAYRALEVTPSASDADIEAAYRRLITQYHPDKVDGAAQEIRELAAKRAGEINAAYDAIQKIRRPS
jgi:DnaJ-domain-containing protein 1